MDLIAGAKASNLVEGLLNEDVQVRSKSVDFTAREILKLDDVGNLDFGGSEFKPCEYEVLEKVKDNEDDKYGWWSLSEGTYLVRFNETVLEFEGLGLLSPHPNLMLCGCTHSTLVLKEWKSDYVVVLEVQKDGVRIKENARISKLCVLK